MLPKYNKKILMIIDTRERERKRDAIFRLEKIKNNVKNVFHNSSKM